MDVVCPKNNWREIFKNLAKKYAIRLVEMDFPYGWEDFNIWKKK
jgi:hypothetical protein